MTKMAIHSYGMGACLAGAILLGACSSGTSTDGGTTNNNTADSGMTSNNNDGGTTNTADAGGPPPTYCDGFAVKDSSGNKIYVQSYGFGKELKSEGCSSTINAYTDSTSVATVGGILDLDTSDNGAATPATAIFPGNCSDFGLTGFTPPTAMAPTVPSGSMTVAAAWGKGTKTATISVYGVVTAVYPWDATNMKAGSIYIEDATTGTPAAHSGTEVYFPKASVASYGTAPAVGDIVNLPGVYWSPYQGVNQFAATSATAVAVIGAGALPPPVMVQATDVGPMSTAATANYEGMRVQVMGGPFTVAGSEKSGTCPAALQYTPPAGG